MKGLNVLDVFSFSGCLKIEKVMDGENRKSFLFLLKLAAAKLEKLLKLKFSHKLIKFRVAVSYNCRVGYEKNSSNEKNRLGQTSSF